MSDTIRELIIQEIITALQAIRVSGGYNTDAGIFVLRGAKITSKTQLPSLSILAGTEENEPIGGSEVLTMRVRVDGVSKANSEEDLSKEAEKLLGDIITCMTNQTAKVAASYDPAVVYIEGGIEDYPEPGHETIACYATFNVKYKFKKGDPYNQN